MSKQINSEISVPNEICKGVIGTLDKKNPIILYFEGGIYIEPTEEQDDIEKTLINVKKDAKNALKSILGEDVEEDIIFVFETAEERIMMGKRSYLSFEATFKPLSRLFEGQPFKIIATTLSPTFSTWLAVLKTILEGYGFKCSKTK
jgi:hypothetical protein